MEKEVIREVNLEFLFPKAPKGRRICLPVLMGFILGELGNEYDKYFEEFSYTSGDLCLEVEFRLVSFGDIEFKGKLIIKDGKIIITARNESPTTKDHINHIRAEIRRAVKKTLSQYKK
jgi:hypothetical protein